MEPKYAVGQCVKIIPVTGSDIAIDRWLRSMSGKAGTVEKLYCISTDEMPDRIKMFVYPDVFSYDIKLDESGEVVRGIPEIALDISLNKRK